jgi:hypothetical protein
MHADERIARLHAHIANATRVQDASKHIREKHNRRSGIDAIAIAMHKPQPPTPMPLRLNDVHIISFVCEQQRRRQPSDTAPDDDDAIRPRVFHTHRLPRR